MRKVVLSVMLIVGSVLGAMAQTDAQAKAILAQVSKKYRSYDIIKADFTLMLNNPQAKLNQSQSGTLYAKSKAN